MVGAALLVVVAGAACSDRIADPTVSTTQEPTTTATTSTTTVIESPRPDPRMGHAMVSVGDGKLLIYGGRTYRGSAEAFLGDTWTYDAFRNEWSELDGAGPQARSQHAMAFDSKRGEVLLFGGYVGSSFTYADTWLLDVADGSWRRVRPPTAPSGRAGSVLVYDEQLDLYVMFAGAEEPPAPELPLAETWLFDPEAETWIDVTSSVAPELVSEGHPTLFELAMVYDKAAQRAVLLIAGEATWTFDGIKREWIQSDRQGTQGLGADYMVAAAFDGRLGRTVAYGGAPVARVRGTWLFDYTAGNWVEAETPPDPGPIVNHAMAYEPRLGATFLFGGATSVLVLDGVAPVTRALWIFDEDGWRLVDS